jgi:hypothetical protein
LERHASGHGHQPYQAKEQTQLRHERIAQLKEHPDHLAGKLDGQDAAGEVKRGRKLSDSSAKARFYREVCEAHLARIIKVHLQGELFTYTIDQAAQAQAELMDGKLLPVTNLVSNSGGHLFRATTTATRQLGA